MRDTQVDEQPSWPQIRTVGLDGLLVSFGDHLNEAANRAALAFRHSLDRESWDGVEETSTSLVSTYLRFDPLYRAPEDLVAAVRAHLKTQDWFEAPLPTGRKLWRIPTVYGTDLAPQLGEAAALAGLSEADAIQQIAETTVRVQTIGFMPGLPYLGTLPEAFDIPRQTDLTASVPVGALTLAIRQLVLFSVSTPTGWRHIGQTAIRLFQPDRAEPFLLRPGDEVRFDPVPREAFEHLKADDALGGARFEALP